MKEKSCIWQPECVIFTAIQERLLYNTGEVTSIYFLYPHILMMR